MRFPRRIFLARRTPATVPAYPLRCQHCLARIKLDKSAPSASFVDEAGWAVCETGTWFSPDDSYIPHRPMPSVLG